MQVSWITLQSGYIVLGLHVTHSHHIIVDINCERFPIWYADVEHFRLFFSTLCYMTACITIFMYASVSVIICVMVNANKHSFIHSYLSINFSRIWQLIILNDNSIYRPNTLPRADIEVFIETFCNILD